MGLPVAVVQRSLEQNEALFTSKSLTVLTLDHLYTFRTSLQSYARTQSPCRLEDAVDELRRLILANGRQRLLKSTLITTYRWLDPVSELALADVERMYSRAYGGLEGESGVENDVDPVPAWPLPDPQVPSSQPSLPEMTECPKPRRSLIDAREGSRTPPLQLPSLNTTPKQSRASRHGWSMAEEKEILGGLLDLGLDDEDLEIDAIEAWYRDVQLPPVEIQVEPEPTVTEIEVREVEQIVNPKLQASPPRRNLALRLQTTFEKPKKILSPGRTDATPQTAGIVRPRPQKPLSLQQEQQQIAPLGTFAGDEEDLTARPVSAIMSQPMMSWNSMSIDGVMLNAPFMDGRVRSTFELHDLTSPASPTSPLIQRLGPQTPNGYDDISPITRNEWGFITRALPKTAPVEMC